MLFTEMEDCLLIPIKDFSIRDSMVYLSIMKFYMLLMLEKIYNKNCYGTKCPSTHLFKQRERSP
ncbi:hypothetical protein JOC77_000503 [Peribacillus deserti]|uniref:Uncharacterized protein n=1 Tax=Peribacillus deserti TaxID=673318 RepID=A0ABS2QD72_9BACI|nr:hypothetical protein [Peribacillus deserti]